jgi:hypothetical protein
MFLLNLWYLPRNLYSYNATNKDYIMILTLEKSQILYRNPQCMSFLYYARPSFTYIRKTDNSSLAHFNGYIFDNRRKGTILK